MWIQKLRRLRMAAFIIVNKMNEACPRFNIASIKRAYRKPPTHGYCPAPEAKFHEASDAQISKAEELLHYWHVCQKDAVACLNGEFCQAAFLANVDVAVAEAFVQHGSDKVSMAAYQKKLLEATAKYHHRLQESLEDVSLAKVTELRKAM